MHRTPELSSRFLTAFAWCDFILSIMRTEFPFRSGTVNRGAAEIAGLEILYELLEQSPHLLR